MEPYKIHSYHCLVLLFMMDTSRRPVIIFNWQLNVIDIFVVKKWFACLKKMNLSLIISQKLAPTETEIFF